MNIWRGLGGSALLTVSGMMLLGACSVLPQPAPLPQQYDFGLPAARSISGGLPLVTLAGVTAPSWLDTTAILYRRLDQRPRSLHYYAQHAWVARPAELLEERLLNLLSQGTPEGSAARPAVLEVNLVQLEQVFESPQSAYAQVAVRVSLDRRPAGLLLRREFSARQATDADVQGALVQLPLLVDEVLTELLAWLQEQQ
ncbi:MAG: ABC-type transport auxiliary lipoprotein family protein [Pseudomonadales bacterium]|nr:ABC-type transport auxiliary lipoprotein family protein [Pseudomonadales bacterium]